MKSKILLVEDNAQNRYLATFLLEQAGFTLLHASNGLEALETARKELPDLVLMDIQMPEMDGYEAARRMLEIEGCENVPIVAVTSYAMAGDRARAMNMGFAGYIEKPIDTAIFVQTVRQFLPTKEEAAT
jgi:two-component system cell cycle response regulator DivK